MKMFIPDHIEIENLEYFFLWALIVNWDCYETIYNCLQIVLFIFKDILRIYVTFLYTIFLFNYFLFVDSNLVYRRKHLHILRIGRST